MKVILLQDVAKVGLRHSVADVPNGYALNKLIPQNLAVPATPENKKKMERELKQREEVSAMMKQAYTDGVSALSSKNLKVTASANDKGHLFEALKVEKIVEAAKANDLDLMADMIAIDAPIKEVGEHTVYLTDGTDKQPFTVLVEKE